MFICFKLMKKYAPVYLKAFFVLCLYVFTTFQPVKAQQKADYFTHTESIAPTKCLLVDLEKPATSATIQWLENPDTKGFYIYADGEKYFVERDADVEEK